MNNLFETLAAITKPEPLPKYYLEKSTGRTYCDQLPKDTYLAEGFNGSIEGQAYWFGWDNGTCLIPYRHTSDDSFVVPNQPFTSSLIIPVRGH